jgi:pimeloyl-ACP methyl ester carboxylesterase
VLARPELVEALVLVGAGLPDHDWSEEMNELDAAEGAALDRGDIDAAVELSVRGWVDGPRRSPEDVDPSVRANVAEMLRRAYELQLPVDGRVEEDRLVANEAAGLGEIDAPTLVVVGEEDVPDMLQIADRLEREIPGARRATIPGAAHVPNMERPSEFDELVLGFLEEVR